MKEQPKPSCSDCKYNNFDGGCAAFPDGIPFKFTAGRPHLEPTPAQGNDIVFEWIDRVEQRARLKKVVAERKAREALLSNSSIG